MSRRRREVSAGGIVIRETPSGRQALLIQTPRGVCSFPKGHVERGEAQHRAAEREVLEEAGVRAKVAAKSGSVQYFFYDRGTLVAKVVHWFLMRWLHGDPVADGVETLDARFVAEREVVHTLEYENERKVWMDTLALIPRVWGNDGTAK